LAAASDSIALRKSDGSLWTAPPAIALVAMSQGVRRHWPSAVELNHSGHDNHYASFRPLQRIVRLHMSELTQRCTAESPLDP
jgi:hypothetical protein